MIPLRHTAEGPALSQVLALMQAAFAPMEGRVDPPSSIRRLDLDALRRATREAEVWSLGDPVQAAVILTPQPASLYVGKLAVDPGARRAGFARRLLDLAEVRARALGLAELVLETRIELVENHTVFAAMGFVRSKETSHPGYTRPTAITWCRRVSANAPQMDATPECP